MAKRVPDRQIKCKDGVAAEHEVGCVRTVRLSGFREDGWMDLDICWKERACEVGTGTSSCCQQPLCGETTAGDSTSSTDSSEVSGQNTYNIRTDRSQVYKYGPMTAAVGTLARGRI